MNKDRHGGVRRWCPPNAGKEPSAGLFTLTPRDGDRLSWLVALATDKDVDAVIGVNLADLLALDQLDPPPHSVRHVAERLHWGKDRATAGLREWRRPGNVPRNAEQRWD